LTTYFVSAIIDCNT